MKVVIVAAGCGSRLENVSDSKPLASLAGKPLLQRVVESIAASTVNGIEKEVLIVTGWRNERIEQFIEPLQATVPIKVSTIHNANWEKGNGTSVLAARALVDAPFMLMMADHVIDPDILNTLENCSHENADLTLAVDRKLDNRYVDPADVTRVFCDGDKIVEIGKHLEPFNAYDTGSFFCTPAFFDALSNAQNNLSDYGISGGVQLLSKAGKASTVDIGDAQWIDVDTPEMLALAQEMLKLQILPD